MNKLVIYHSNCSDGFCSAWLCHLVWPDAEFVPANYGWDPPDVTKKDVLIVDFSYPRETLLKMREQAASIRVLDHHETAKKALDGLEFCTFDLTKSGARLTYNYLIENGLLTDQSINWLVSYVEDYDLQLKSLPSHEEICTAIRNYDTEFAIWDELSKRDPKSLIMEGIPVLRYQNRQIDHHVRYAQIVDILGHKGVGCQCSMNKLWTKVASGLLDKFPDAPFAVIWQDTVDNFRLYSLRARTGGFHVGQLAERLGGGGHPGAAGFRVDFQLQLGGPVIHSHVPKAKPEKLEA